MSGDRDALSLSDECFHGFSRLIHQLTGITIAANRKSMLQGRLRKRVLELGLDYESYLRLVPISSVEKTLFVDMVTTNETSFFRTPRIWDYIEKKFLPSWSAMSPRRELRVWSAAASSGEEAHSLGICCQLFREGHPGFQYRILGTDVSEEMVSLCREGLYGGRSIEAFRQGRKETFARYMKSEGAAFRAGSEIRDRLNFQRHNLFEPLRAGGPFDLVLLRNVLIYFAPADQEKVLARVRTQLTADGILIIGESETLSHIDSHFKPVEPLVYVPTAEAA